MGNLLNCSPLLSQLRKVTAGLVEMARRLGSTSLEFFFFKQKTAYEIGLGIPAEPLFRSGMKMLTMTNLSTECLIQLTKLGYDATPFNQILKQNAKREMRLRLGKVTVADVLAAQPVTTN